MQQISEKTKTTSSNILMNVLSEKGFTSIQDFQRSVGVKPDGVFGDKSYAFLYELLLDVRVVNFFDFIRTSSGLKNQIVWHHTEGHDNAESVFEWWTIDKVKGVSTSVVIEKNGTVYKGFDENNWGYSLGVTRDLLKRFNSTSNNENLNKLSVCVELTNAGGLKLQENKKISQFGSDCTETSCSLKFRGFDFYDSYTVKQIQSLKYWTLLNALRFDIPLFYSYERLFTTNSDALGGKKGLFTHCSFRPPEDKQDLSPQPILIEMAKNLITYEAK